MKNVKKLTRKDLQMVNGGRWICICQGPRTASVSSNVEDPLAACAAPSACNGTVQTAIQYNGGG